MLYIYFYLFFPIFCIAIFSVIIVLAVNYTQTNKTNTAPMVTVPATASTMPATSDAPQKPGNSKKEVTPNKIDDESMRIIENILARRAKRNENVPVSDVVEVVKFPDPVFQYSYNNSLQTNEEYEEADDDFLEDDEEYDYFDNTKEYEEELERQAQLEKEKKEHDLKVSIDDMICEMAEAAGLGIQARMW